MTTRLTRSRRDKVIAGVCGGLAQYFEVDPTLVRLIFVVLLFSGGLAVPLYFVLWFVMPKAARTDASDWSRYGTSEAYAPFRDWRDRPPASAAGPDLAGSGAASSGGAPGATAAGFAGAASADPTGSAFAGAPGAPFGGSPGGAFAGSGAPGGGAGAGAGAGTPPPTGDPFSDRFGPSPFSGGPGSFGAPETPPFGPYPWLDDDLKQTRDRRRPLFLAMLLIGAGLILLAYNMNLLGSIRWSVIWPAMLIVLGTALLLGKRNRRRRW